MSFQDPEQEHVALLRAARQIIGEIETVIAEAQAATRPLEVDPWRERLFGCFVDAYRRGLIPDEAEAAAFEDFEEDDPELRLNADTLCRLLARRWGLDMAAREAQAMQTRLPADQLERMRLLWSVMRMWIEWSYAWRRWSELQGGSDAGEASSTEDFDSADDSD